MKNNQMCEISLMLFSFLFFFFLSFLFFFFGGGGELMIISLTSQEISA